MRYLIAAAPLVLLAGCVSAPAPPPPPAEQTPLPRPAPAPVIPASSDWRDWPLTPGDWTYRRNSYSTDATFGTPGRPLFVMSCDNDRKVRLARTSTLAAVMRIRTSSTVRALTTQLTGHPPTGNAATLAASDPLLDAIGFSRGRFVVEQPGLPTLVIPAWAEILRVTEDCRG